MAARANAALQIHDVTLREGEQAADVNFSVGEKMRILEKLANAGITRTQGGFPGRSELDFAFIREAKENGPPIFIEAAVQGFAGDWKQQVELALEAGSDGLSLMFPSYQARLQRVHDLSEAAALDRVATLVTFAVAQVGDAPVRIRFTPTDALRATLPFLRDLYRTAVDSGANAISLSDTVGCAAPHAAHYLTSFVVRSFPTLPVQVHFHNDFGLALANAIAAVDAGAAVVDCTVNGLGERAGNVDMAQFATTMQYVYGIDIGIDLASLTGLAQMVADIAGVPIPPAQPLTGGNAFAHKLDGHVQLLDRDSSLVEAIGSAVVGNQRRLPLGKHSGPYVVGKHLSAIGVELDQPRLAAVVAEVARQSIRLHRSLTDEEFRKIAAEAKDGAGAGAAA
jgi:isopropylmalate/homocitrate/citramalate synthase